MASAAESESSAASAPQVNESQSRQDFVNSMMQSVMTTLHDANKPFAQKQAMLKQTFTSVVDLNWIARFVLGKTWNGTTDEQKTQYTSLYRTYLTNTYVSNFDEESAGKLKDIKVLGVKDRDEDTFLVRTEMALADADAVKVDYLASGHGGQYKVIDIRVEGVSLLETHRAEFSELAAAGGITGVIGKLQQMVGHDNGAIALSMK